MKLIPSLPALLMGAALFSAPAFAQGDTGNQTASGSASTGVAQALSSVPDTQKKYKRASRARDFQKEAETTKQLNQQVSSSNGIVKSQ